MLPVYLKLSKQTSNFGLQLTLIGGYTLGFTVNNYKLYTIIYIKLFLKGFKYRSYFVIESKL